MGSARDKEREQRISMEIIVDAYSPEEQALGWYYSLEDRLGFPFVARCVAERASSPLRAGDEVEVGMRKVLTPRPSRSHPWWRPRLNWLAGSEYGSAVGSRQDSSGFAEAFASRWRMEQGAFVSLASAMGPGSCHELGTTWSGQRAWWSPFLVSTVVGFWRRL